MLQRQGVGGRGKDKPSPAEPRVLPVGSHHPPHAEVAGAKAAALEARNDAAGRQPDPGGAPVGRGLLQGGKGEAVFRRSAEGTADHASG